MWSSAIGYIICSRCEKKTTVSGQNINRIWLNKLWMSWKDFSLIIRNYLIAFLLFCKKRKRQTHISVSVRQFLISTTNLSLGKNELYLDCYLPSHLLINFLILYCKRYGLTKKLPRWKLLTIEPVPPLGEFLSLWFTDTIIYMAQNEVY